MAFQLPPKLLIVTVVLGIIVIVFFFREEVSELWDTFKDAFFKGMP